MKYLLVSAFAFILFQSASGQSQGRSLTFHLRGVAESDISIIPLSGRDAFKAISFQKQVKDGGTARINVPGDYLPGEFVVRFDYKETEESSPYPAEKQVLLAGEDLELWVHPIYSNNPDSTWFQKGEKENTTFAAYQAANSEKRKMLGVLQEFLLAYDNTSAKVYKAALKEYGKRRAAYNSWIRSEAKKQEGLYAASLFGFDLIPATEFAGSDDDRKASLRRNYFNEVSFDNPLMVRSSQMKRWMDGYVNLHSQMITQESMMDSIFTLAGKTAIEQAKKGNPVVYGWMVDYFFRGYESFGLQKGMTMLAPYLEDPKCMTERRQAIEKRLKGMETLVPGTLAPDFTYYAEDDSSFQFHDFRGETPYKMVLFWSANCGHCKELVAKLYPWSQEKGRSEKLTIFALSVDEGEKEVVSWNTEREKMPGWKHMLTYGGVNSQEANAYFILSTPVMALVDTKTNRIVAMPQTIDQVEKAMK
jgi:thiol-disulfide isomerase/thioredoxin